MGEILQKVEAVPAALRELVVGNAEGNPFYIEELVKMLIEDGAIHVGLERLAGGARPVGGGERAAFVGRAAAGALRPPDPSRSARRCNAPR